MKSLRKNTKYSKVETDRRTVRYTYRADADIYDYIYKKAKEKNIPINSLLDYIIWEYKKKEGEENNTADKKL